MYELIDAELVHLSERKQTIYNLHFRMEKSYELIARFLHVSEGYIRSEVRKIKKYLIKKLGHYKKIL